MNRNHLIAAFGVLMSVAAVSVFAQGPTPAKSQPSAAQTTTTVIPVSKVAVIYSEEFQDPKTGIARFGVLVNTLNREFQPRQTELDRMAQRIKELQDEVNKLQQGVGVVSPAQLQAKVDELNQLKKDYQRKGEDAQAAYQKRKQDLFGPLQDEVGKALDAYAKARGITIILDGSQVPLIYAAESINITRQFISDYNSKNPATASATSPK